MELSEIQACVAKLEKQIAALPSGSITKKTIRGKEYFYHRWMENKKRREKYIPADELVFFRDKIVQRKVLEQELKALKRHLPKAKAVGTAAFTANILTGEALLLFASPVRGYRKRECYQRLHDFVYGTPQDKVFILYGLRRTGKTTMIRQIFTEMSDAELSRTAFIQITKHDSLANVNNDLKLLESQGFRYVFLDEVTLMEDFIEGAALFSDVFAACGMKIVLSGTDSLGLIFAEDEQLYDRCILLHTTFIPYRELKSVLCIHGIDEPKIIYIPSERNILTVLVDSENMKNLPLMVSILVEECRKTRKALAKKSHKLPISNIQITYDQNASSGIQSVTPLSIVSDYLSEEVNSPVLGNIQSLSLTERESLRRCIKGASGSDESLELELNEAFDQLFKTGSVSGIDNDKAVILKTILNRYFNSRFINIVEEPEQNLYPESRCMILYKLLECLNSNTGNQLMITTHSPYMILYLTLSAKAKQLVSVGVPADRISHIVPECAMVSGDLITIYETDKSGNIRRLKPYDDLPSDENILNKEMSRFNDLFSDLLELEAEFCD